jgi:antitoxin ParD1/3/4
MATVEKVSIALTHDMAAVVRQAVESGDYATSSEVVRDALRDWKTKRDLQAQRLEGLRRLWHEGLDSGAGRFEGIDDLLAEARRRFETQG